MDEKPQPHFNPTRVFRRGISENLNDLEYIKGIPTNVCSLRNLRDRQPW